VRREHDDVARLLCRDCHDLLPGLPVAHELRNGPTPATDIELLPRIAQMAPEFQHLARFDLLRYVSRDVGDDSGLAAHRRRNRFHHGDEDDLAGPKPGDVL